jgi:hypothetical protein
MKNPDGAVEIHLVSKCVRERRALEDCRGHGRLEDIHVGVSAMICSVGVLPPQTVPLSEADTRIVISFKICQG